MRSGVENKLTGFDGMMSQALTKAIMGDDDAEIIDMSELRWGGTGDSIEIEATALYEVSDWVKRKESAGLEEKYVFLNSFCCFILRMPVFHIICHFTIIILQGSFYARDTRQNGCQRTAWCHGSRVRFSSYS
jgi:hypothetical protein